MGNYVRAVAWSSDGVTLASGSDGNTVRIWNGNTGAHLRTLTGHTNRVNAVAWSSDGMTLASGSHDKTVRTWNEKTCEPTKAPTKAPTKVPSNLPVQPVTTKVPTKAPTKAPTKVPGESQPVNAGESIIVSHLPLLLLILCTMRMIVAP